MVEEIEHQRPTNQVFCHILDLAEHQNRTIYTKYVPSTQNPADAPSRGHYPTPNLLLEHITVPTEVRPFLIDIY